MASAHIARGDDEDCRNNVNKGNGSFEFPINAIEAYLTKVREAKDSTIDRKDGKVNISIRKDKTTREIMLDEKNGRGEYKVRQ